MRLCVSRLARLFSFFIQNCVGFSWWLIFAFLLAPCGLFSCFWVLLPCLGVSSFWGPKKAQPAFPAGVKTNQNTGTNSKPRNHSPRFPRLLPVRAMGRRRGVAGQGACQHHEEDRGCDKGTRSSGHEIRTATATNQGTPWAVRLCLELVSGLVVRKEHRKENRCAMLGSSTVKSHTKRRKPSHRIGIRNGLCFCSACFGVSLKGNQQETEAVFGIPYLGGISFCFVWTLVPCATARGYQEDPL